MAALEEDAARRETGDRGYLGHWQVHAGRLYLTALGRVTWEPGCGPWGDVPLPLGMVAQVMSALGTATMPVPAVWFDGTLRIPFGRRLVHQRYVFSCVHEVELVLNCRAGRIERARVVDTMAIAERYARRTAIAEGAMWLPRDLSLFAGPRPLWLDDYPAPEMLAASGDHVPPSADDSQRGSRSNPMRSS